MTGTHVRSLWRPSFDMSTPSITIRPSSASKSLRSDCTRVDLPDPVLRFRLLLFGVRRRACVDRFRDVCHHENTGASPRLYSPVLPTTPTREPPVTLNVSPCNDRGSPDLYLTESSFTSILPFAGQFFTPSSYSLASAASDGRSRKPMTRSTATNMFTNLAECLMHYRKRPESWINMEMARPKIPGSMSNHACWWTRTAAKLAIARNTNMSASILKPSHLLHEMKAKKDCPAETKEGRREQSRMASKREGRMRRYLPCASCTSRNFSRKNPTASFARIVAIPPRLSLSMAKMGERASPSARGETDRGRVGWRTGS